MQLRTDARRAALPVNQGLHVIQTLARASCCDLRSDVAAWIQMWKHCRRRRSCGGSASCRRIFRPTQHGPDGQGWRLVRWRQRHPHQLETGARAKARQASELPSCRRYGAPDPPARRHKHRSCDARGYRQCGVDGRAQTSCATHPLNMYTLVVVGSLQCVDGKRSRRRRGGSQSPEK